MMSNFGRNLALWVIIALLLVVLFNLFQPGGQQKAAVPVPYSEFLNDVNAGKVKNVVIQGRVITVTEQGSLNEPRRFQTYMPEDPNLVSVLTSKGIPFEAQKEDTENHLINILLSWFPMLLLIGVWVFFMRQMQSGGGWASAKAERGC